MKPYIITFDTDAIEVSTVHAIITNLSEIGKWWHYINGTYIVMSSHTTTQLREVIEKQWPGGRYLIIEVKGHANGRLPQKAWDWINSNVPR